MDRKSADRIIVKSNARMKKVIEWYYANKEWLDKEEFHAPMESGVIELQEEMLEITFESKGDIVELAIYPTVRPNIPATLIYDYDPRTWISTNYRFAPQLPKAKRDLLRIVTLADNTDKKEALKYHLLMLFMVHYREVVTVKDTGTRTRKEAKRIRKSSKGPLPLIRKSYVIEDFENKTIQKSGEKRPYTKPDHEVNVRGFMRHYKKSGKTVWIGPSVRYKGKGTSRKEYEL